MVITGGEAVVRVYSFNNFQWAAYNTGVFLPARVPSNKRNEP